MIEDALAGNIDLIITKSISRFARNTVDTLTVIRQLKKADVAVWFEKEDINTLDAKGEFLITLMSSLAQEESRSISENCTWGQRKRYADGKATVPFQRFLGYDRGPQGEFVVNEKEARIVRAIYGMAVLGFSVGKIKNKLNDLTIPSPAKKMWGIKTIYGILSNEKYKGDALLQKTFTVDYLTKKTKKNEGELPKYYVEDHHQGLVSREVFDYVQQLSIIQKGRSNRTHEFSDKLVCEVCGDYFTRRTWHATSENSKDSHNREEVWQCKKLTKCKTPHVYDKRLMMGIEEAIRWKVKQSRELAELVGTDEVLINLIDAAIVIESILVKKDRTLLFHFLDGDEHIFELGWWTPKKFKDTR